LNSRTAAGRSCASSAQSANRVPVRSPATAKCLTLLFALCVAPCAAQALDLVVSVIDRDGHPIADAVVTAVDTGAARGPRAPGTAIMDQQQLQFVPQVLVIATGSKVEFPNSDAVSHQVYSFSPAKRFQLPLYKGTSHPPVVFDRAGLVVLGCNIHDNMVGYIDVTDAPYFGKTDSAGALHLTDLTAGSYQLVVWGPRIADPAPSLTRTVTVGPAAETRAEFRLTLPLRARPEPRPRRSDWDY
jgi:plastocyanin